MLNYPILDRPAPALFELVLETLPQIEKLELGDGGVLRVEWEEGPFEMEWSPSRSELVVRGDVDLRSCRRLASLVDCLVEVGQRKLWLDLSEVHYLDACGVASLLRCQLRLRRHGGKLVVVGLSTQVHRVLKLLGLSELLQQQPTAPTRRPSLSAVAG